MALRCYHITDDLILQPCIKGKLHISCMIYIYIPRMRGKDILISRKNFNECRAVAISVELGKKQTHNRLWMNQEH